MLARCNSSFLDGSNGKQKKPFSQYPTGSVRIAWLNDIQNQREREIERERERGRER
jgi:hypothetical protein